MSNDTTKFNIVHRLRLHEAAVRQDLDPSETGELDLADTLLQARTEIFRLRMAVSTYEDKLMHASLGLAVIALVDEAKAALDAVPPEATNV